MQGTSGTRERGGAFVGKYVLDSLSFGMYDHPLMALREYVQNSVDAIDDTNALPGWPNDGKGSVEISVDGRHRSLEIKDDGTGIPAGRAWSVLHDLGRSEKDQSKRRGFRGIGRLGGLGYCDTLTFTTKAQGEDVVSTASWDCRKLRSLVGGNGDHSVASIIRQVTTFAQDRYDGDTENHFFIVKMNDVRSSRDVLLSVPAMRAYLSQVGPVPFDQSGFRFAEQIDEILRKSVGTYDTYSIRVNGNPVRKLHSDKIGISQHGLERVEGIQIFQIESEETGPLALGWLMQLELRGTIWPSSYLDGLRLRSGNIQIGGKETLSGLFREKRFCNYLAGEVHLTDMRLAPNSRRDEIEDSALKDTFHSCFIRDVGIPYSKRIRDLSAERSRAKRSDDASSLIRRAELAASHGYLAESQKRDLLRRLKSLNDGMPSDRTDKDLDALVRGVQACTHVLNNGAGSIPRSSRRVVKQVFETIYEEMENKAQAEALMATIVADLLPSSGRSVVRGDSG